MSLRVFTCHHCGHQLRLGAGRCGRCDAAAPLMNMTVVHLVFFAAALTLAVVGAALIVK